MKHIAIAAEDNHMKAEIAFRAGQAPWFCIVNDLGEYEFVPNPGHSAQAAYGMHTLDYLQSLGIDTVLARFFGPRFYAESRNSGISLLIPPGKIRNIKDVIDSVITKNHKTMPNYNRKGPENEGPRTGRKLGKSNPDNKGLTDEEMAQKNANKPQRGNRGGKRDGTGRGSGKGQGRRDGSGGGQGKGRGRGQGRGRQQGGK